MRRTVLSILILVSLPVCAREWKPVYGLDFDWIFNNHEYSASHDAFASSHTLAAARLTPSLGIMLPSRDGTVHSVIAGADFTRQFGSPFSIMDLVSEATLYYSMRKPFGNGCRLFLTAGVFPRKLLGGEYTEAVISEDLRFLDNNLDGLLVQVRTPRGRYEVCLDWNGMKAPGRRERFNILTEGNFRFNNWLSAGWQGMFQHYAGMADQGGIVVDEDFLNPYLRLSLGRMTGMKALDFTAGMMAAYQRDRRARDRRYPLGADFVAEIRHWSLGVRNELYWGASMAPFWAGTDITGTPYADNLYFRSPFYQVSLSGGNGFYDKAEAWWMPRLGKWVYFRLAVAFHFNGAFSGWQQTAAVVFNLNSRK